MKNYVAMGATIGAAIVLAALIQLYYSPYQTCVRAFVHDGAERSTAEELCAISGRRS